MSLFPLLVTGLLAMCAQLGAAASHQHTPLSANRYFYGCKDRALVGQAYRNLTGASRTRCGAQCLADQRCFSFNYWDAESGNASRCELNGASAARFPLAVSGRTGGSYCGPEKTFVVGKLAVLAEARGDKGLPGLTDRVYDTQALASGDCQAAGQHLCELWEVSHACAAGYAAILPSDTDFWYAVPDSQAVASDGGQLTQHGLPVTASSPGICCPGAQLSPRDPVVTGEAYSLHDVAGQARGCSELSAHPCTLAELKAAYLRGYRQPSSAPEWLFMAVPDYDARLFADGCGPYIGLECYEDVVANTPRPHGSTRLFCCPNLYQ